MFGIPYVYTQSRILKVLISSFCTFVTDAGGGICVVGKA